MTQMKDDSPDQLSFNGLLEQYYSAWFRFHPETAVHVGVSGYEDQLRPFSDEQIGALTSLNQKIVCSLQEINLEGLTTASQLDYIILYNAASIELHDLLERDWRYFKPQAYLPLEAIHQLVNRPVENLHQALKHRLQAIPEYLRSAKNYLQQSAHKIPHDWVADTIQGANSGADYYRTLLKNPIILSKFKNPARLQPVCDDAMHAMEDFEKFLRQDILPKAKGDFSCGKVHFEYLLHNWHCLDIDVQQLHQFGKTLFYDTQQQLQHLSEQLSGTKNIQKKLADIRESHPAYNNGELLNAYRTRMKSAYDFVKNNDLVSVPDIQALKVVETPLFMRHEIPFAAYDEPSYNDPEQRGYYYVTPVKSEGHLLEHNWTSIDLTCVHEAFPGHHLQFVRANQNPENSLPRMLSASATLYEGWALYCEDLMYEQGFLNKPEHQFMMLRDRLWRAMRVMLDVELHTTGLTVESAAQRMCKELGFSIDEAKADLSWYTQSPTVPMGYAVGWALIKALRNEESKKPDFDLKVFHDRLLSVGSCALPLVIQYEFGEDAWLKVRGQVFES